MAVLSEIRKRSWILIVIVALGLLAFLIDPSTIFSNINQVDPNTYGIVDGEVITREDYDAAMQTVQQQSQGRIPQEQLPSQAWQGAVRSTLIEKLSKDAGLDVNESILYAYQPEMKARIEELQSMADQGDANAQQQLKQLPLFIESQIKNLNAYLYNSLLTAATLTNKLEVQHAKKNFEKSVVNYARVDYENYNQKNPTEVTDEDLKKYVSEHKTAFKREASTGLQYVYFPSKPSKKDQALFNRNMNAFINGGLEYDLDSGKKIDSVKSFTSVTNDSAYVNRYSVKPYDGNFYGVQQISQIVNQQVAKWVPTAAVGSVYGPTEKNEFGVISKLVAVKAIDSVRVRHILIGFQGAQNSQSTMTKEQAQQFANTTLEKVKSNPASFPMEARNVSQDPGSSQRGGELGWVTSQTNFVPEFKNYVLNNPAGAYGVVESPFGYHIINIQEKKQGKAYKLANIYKENRASEATKDSLYKVANKYFAEIKDGSLQDMVTLAEKNKYVQNEAKDVTRFQGVLPGLNTSEDENVIKWSFEDASKVGTSHLFTTPDGSYIVARVTARTPKGEATPNQLRNTPTETIVRNEKIAKTLVPSIKGKTIDQVASEYNTQIQSDSLSLNQLSTQKLGFEPKVIGAASGLANGSVSQPIDGTSGVFVMKKVGTAPAATVMTDEQLKQRLEQLANNNTQIIIQTLIQEADIEDNRAKILQ